MYYKNICEVSHCDKYIHTQGLCSKHYFRKRDHGSPTYKNIVPVYIKRTGRVVVKKRCSMNGCASEAYVKGYCRKHYARWYHYGDAKFVKKVVGENRTAHPLYKAYHAMHDRCENPNNTHYEYYGGRGISVCKRWSGNRGFPNFLKDMGERPDGYSLDRINNNGNYEPKNCRWATKATQSYNQRISVVNTSGHTGVHYYKNTGRWTAYINLNGKRKHLGYFDTKELAIKARNDLEREKIKCQTILNG